MLKRIDKKLGRVSRHRRVRGKISGSATRPRVSVFRSLRAISAQAFDDVLGVTLAQANLGETGKAPKNTVEGAEKVGEMLGDRLKGLGIEAIVFDRSGYKYHGKVKSLAEGLRSKGIQF